MKKQTGQPVKTKEKLSFEKALERLAKIVAEMEEGKLGLEDMISRFEEGQALIKFCSQKLNEVERKIEVLVKKGDEVTTEPFVVQGEEEEGKDEEPEGESSDKGGSDAF